VSTATHFNTKLIALVIHYIYEDYIRGHVGTSRRIVAPQFLPHNSLPDAYGSSGLLRRFHPLSLLHVEQPADKNHL